jgi:hypothetical protein
MCECDGERTVAVNFAVVVLFMLCAPYPVRFRFISGGQALLATETTLTTYGRGQSRSCRALSRIMRRHVDDVINQQWPMRLDMLNTSKSCMEMLYCLNKDSHVDRLSRNTSKKKFDENATQRECI